jgi:hypothetical protein
MLTSESTGSEVEQPYLVLEHLRTQQSIGPFPARLLLPLVYAGVYAGLPLARWRAELSVGCAWPNETSTGWMGAPRSSSWAA